MSATQLFLDIPYIHLQLYANYLGQHLRYQHSLPSPAHSFQAQHAQMMLPGTVMMPGMSGMTSMTSLMGYGHVPQYPGYGNHLIGLPSYASYHGWPTGAHATVAGSRAASLATGMPMLRSQLPTLPTLPNTLPSMATSAPVFYPQLFSGLPAIIPR